MRLIIVAGRAAPPARRVGAAVASLRVEGPVVQQLVTGGIAGTVATVLMSIPVFGAQRLGMVHQPPPIAISKEVAKKSPLLPTSGTPGFPAVWVLAHFAYGALGGAAYSLIRPKLTLSWPASGLLFGGIVWTGSYAGYLPALDLYPAPTADREPRVATMIVAHAIYGLVVAAVVESIDR